MERDVKLLAVVGMSGSGKSEAVKYLTENGWAKVYFGGMIYAEMKRRGIEITPSSQQKFREEIRAKEGKDWVVKQVIAQVNDLVAAGQKKIVLDGLYTWTEYRILKHEYPENLTVVAIVLPRKLRYDRVAKRSERAFNAEEIRERDRTEIENLEKGGPIAMADEYIMNDDSLEYMYKQIERIISCED